MTRALILRSDNGAISNAEYLLNHAKVYGDLIPKCFEILIPKGLNLLEKNDNSLKAVLLTH